MSYSDHTKLTAEEVDREIAAADRWAKVLGGLGEPDDAGGLAYCERPTDREREAHRASA